MRTIDPEKRDGVAGIRFLGERILPHRMQFEGTTVGGLSGIDFDHRSGRWVIISDDRSELHPARFYTAVIDVDEHGPSEVRITGVHTLLDPEGQPFPAFSAAGAASIDPEDIRVDPRTGDYWWSQEGTRGEATEDGEEIAACSVHIAAPDGRHRGFFPLPANYLEHGESTGPRRNYSLESITFAARGALFISALEGPLLQDGPLSTTEVGALSRISVQNRRGRTLGQYAYRQEPLFTEPPTEGRPAHGVSAVLAYPGSVDRLLVLERTFMPGHGFKVWLFEVTLHGAVDVLHVDALAGVSGVALRKRLLIDFDELPLPWLDNLEGMAWGPLLPTGERVLLLVSDDGFHPREVTQFVALALR
ncbi:esterase-like activity of phytase family protein [Actinoplanes rectilineatus]|uniref:esterase-like activity of phytase family protein n=1 Tax=Actinoplanes rectilineatus TaxID=113571 RepID=UPI0005F2D0B2|nr:esterase-like activity of phytase family protein [Actinoplanes rectilineatus]